MKKGKDQHKDQGGKAMSDDSLWDFGEIYASLDKLITETDDAGIQKNIEDAKRSFGMLREASQEALKLKAMLSDGEIWDFADMPPVSGLAVLYLSAIMDSETTERANEILSNNGKVAANIRHAPNKKKKDSFLAEWDAFGSEYKGQADFARIIQRRDRIEMTVRQLTTWISDHEKKKRGR